MVIRRLSYLLDPDPPPTPDPPADPSAEPDPDLVPDTGGILLRRLRPAPEGEAGVSGDLRAQVEQIITLTHGRTRHGVLSCSRLPAGGSLLSNSRPDGAHPDGQRQFIDVLHLPAGAAGFDRVWPIDTWRSPSWDTPAPDEEPADLLPVPGGHFSHELLVRFAKERAPRVAPFLADVRRLFADPAGRQIVIAEEDPETVVRWIALACASLPEESARALTFVTDADEPHNAPQQIIGIGPDSAFDRHDPLLLDHLYRVHDGLGGPGSPYVSDVWAKMKAEMWLAGTPGTPGAAGFSTAGDAPPLPAAGPPPVPGAPGPPAADAAPPGSSPSGTAVAADPFDLAALVPQLLRTGGVLGDGPTGPEGSAPHTVVASFVAAAQDPAQDAAGIEELTRVCQELGKHCPESVTDPLALVLARRRLASALDQDTGPRHDPLVGLPLGEAAQRLLRSEFGPRFDKALGRTLRRPVPEWAGPLHLALVLHGPQGPGVEDAVRKLVRVLLQPQVPQCAEAVAVLKSVGHQGLNRSVLAKITVETAGRRSHLLRELLMSPHGEWVRSHLDIAPPSVRLVELAVRWGGSPHHLRGFELFAKLAEPAPGAAVSAATDPLTLETLWGLVWGAGQPERPDFPRIFRICGADAIFAANLGARFLTWFTSPGRFDRALVDFAHAVHRRGEPGPRELATAQLLVLADDFARSSGSARDVVDRVGELRRDGAPVDPSVWEGVQYLLARGFAGLPPQELYQSGALSYLATGETVLQQHYRAAVQAQFADDAKIRSMAAQPEIIADLFFVWRKDLTRSSREWHATVDELLRQTVAVVLRRMTDEQRSAVATRLVTRSKNWLQSWLSWSNRVVGGGSGDTQIPGAPASYAPGRRPGQEQGYGQGHRPGQPGPPPTPHVPGQPPPPQSGGLPPLPPKYPPGYSPSHPPP
ncbi:GTPase-associated protein 1-related protein [Streptomyces sp. NPDC058653]|uniref:GTPase-associated protein 1-related protein n=1 Tax=Streptomyces sp. NPDC058653 TaxID=3346576 RepID=UPI00365AF3E6